jgi:hypothetical protein
MMQHAEDTAEVVDLVNSVCNGTATSAEVTRLEQLLATSDSALRCYLECVDIEAQLICRCGAGAAASAPSAADIFSTTQFESASAYFPQIVPHKSKSADARPVGFVHGLVQAATNYFPEGAIFAYSVATVLFAVGLLAASLIIISPAVRSGPGIVGQTPPSAPAAVATVTGTADCRWAHDRSTTPPAVPGDSVSIGRTYAIRSGLLEITYDGGAMVILEGPAVFRVDSATGGFLSRGKLCARIDGVAGSWGERTANPDHSAAGMRPTPSLAPRPSGKVESRELRVESHSQLFTVRTPTAVVTDLGTEFGVEVNDKGDTVSHVYRGAVRFQVVAGDKANPQTIVMRQNQSARVEKDAVAGTLRLIPPRSITERPDFVRRLDRPLVQIDLLEIIGGGTGADGYGRGGGGVSLWINPDAANSKGAAAASPGKQPSPVRFRYQRSPKDHPLIDGAFMPDSGGGNVQLDSAGHQFNGFGKLSSATFSGVWARGADPRGFVSKNDELNQFYHLENDRQFMPEGRGLLGCYGSAGVTFDMESMRRAYKTVLPARFRAVAGVAQTKAEGGPAAKATDLWVFIDGRMKFHRERVQPQDGAFRINIEISPRDRFLTLVATETGNGVESRWSVFGDPVLELVAGRSSADSESVRKSTPNGPEE